MTALDDSRQPPGLFLTQAGYDAVRSELAQLRAERDQRLAAHLREARSPESAEPYEDLWAAQEEELVYEARIARLAEVLRRATIVDGGPSGVVAIGSRVSVEDDRGKVHDYEIVGSHQAAGRGVVSAGSPVGQALLGQPSGASVAVELPDGRMRSLRIVEVADAA